MGNEVIAAIAGATVTAIFPLMSAIVRKLSGRQYMTRSDCRKHHEQLREDTEALQQKHREDCDQCRAATKASICSIQHDHNEYRKETTAELQKQRKLLVLIAMENQIPKEKLLEFL